ncbi:hypothetical protein FNW02_07235 [Komarekiella sp. 'clone 1']|uniref:Uncharacterized protein n=1 Tax=Komarekiella delphini-convector SJRDD-AB1 TaxID=2593771 RepID=A0AA40SUR0_9NOST|nr:hypothetical protein [Komarekiella delphini-convector]MBD6615633.1 hypothetical protein [Komarekiella delphini-convector SJRDD-AB1]
MAGLKIIAIIHSDYYGVSDIQGQAAARLRIESSSMLTGSVHRLQRSEDVSQRPMVQALVGLSNG